MAHVGSKSMRFGDYGRLLLKLLGLPPVSGCPRCRSPRLVELVYGELCPEALAAARSGLVRLGGRPMEWDTPDLSCLDCGADAWVDGRWREPAGCEALALGPGTADNPGAVVAMPTGGVDLGEPAGALIGVIAAGRGMGLREAERGVRCADRRHGATPRAEEVEAERGAPGQQSQTNRKADNTGAECPPGRGSA
jgi:hypothetical protein